MHGDIRFLIATRNWPRPSYNGRLREFGDPYEEPLALHDCSKSVLTSLYEYSLFHGRMALNTQQFRNLRRWMLWSIWLRHNIHGANGRNIAEVLPADIKNALKVARDGGDLARVTVGLSNGQVQTGFTLEDLPLKMLSAESNEATLPSATPDTPTAAVASSPNSTSSVTDPSSLAAGTPAPSDSTAPSNTISSSDGLGTSSFKPDTVGFSATLPSNGTSIEQLSNWRSVDGQRASGQPDRLAASAAPWSFFPASNAAALPTSLPTSSHAPPLPRPSQGAAGSSFSQYAGGTNAFSRLSGIGTPDAANPISSASTVAAPLSTPDHGGLQATVQNNAIIDPDAMDWEPTVPTTIFHFNRSHGGNIILEGQQFARTFIAGKSVAKRPCERHFDTDLAKRPRKRRTVCTLRLMRNTESYSFKLDSAVHASDGVIQRYAIIDHRLNQLDDLRRDLENQLQDAYENLSDEVLDLAEMSVIPHPVFKDAPMHRFGDFVLNGSDGFWDCKDESGVRRISQKALDTRANYKGLEKALMYAQRNSRHFRNWVLQYVDLAYCKTMYAEAYAIPRKSQGGSEADRAASRNMWDMLRQMRVAAGGLKA